MLRLIDQQTGKPIPTRLEAKENSDRVAKRALRRVRQEKRQKEQEKQRAHALEHEILRLDALEAELIRLRAELAKHKEKKD